MSESGSEPDTGSETEQSATTPEPSDDEESRTRSVTNTERLQRLQAENERLRREYDRARQVEYGRTAGGLAVVGALAVGAAVIFPSVRDVLLIIGSIGLFAAVLTRFLTPERFLPIDVAEGIYDSIDETRADLVAELELAGDPQYVPTGGDAVRLYVPQREGTPLPNPEELQSTIVVPDDERRGIAFAPSGKTLFREFRRTLSDELGETPRVAAGQLAEGISEGLELVDSANSEVDSASNRVSMRFTGVPFGAIDRIDHPVVSFVGVGLAASLKTAVSVADTRVDDDGAVVTYTWESDDETTGTQDGDT